MLTCLTNAGLDVTVIENQSVAEPSGDGNTGIYTPSDYGKITNISPNQQDQKKAIEKPIRKRPFLKRLIAWLK